MLPTTTVKKSAGGIYLKIHNKLVRDNVPQIIAANGERAVTRTLDDQEYLVELVKKLGEEYGEFEKALNIEELADIQEVVLSLADSIASRDELEKARAAKAVKRGTFKDRIFLEKTE